MNHKQPYSPEYPLPRRHARYAEKILQDDASGWQTFSYGKLGEMTEEIRTFVLPNESQTYTFRMGFSYDSWNRIQEMTYPDGEVVSYRYDRGGMLESVRGDKGGDHRTYIEDISYNTHGLKESVFYGNGTHTDYGYDLLMRLSHLYSENSSGEAMQDIDYGYDDADNITDIFNNAATLANGLGGNYWSHYDYDNLYRLGHAEGDWGGGQLNYHLDMQYHPNGRIERKELYADVMDHTGTVTVSNYSNSYQYNAGQPNTLGNVTDDFTGWEQNFSWDAAGNMTVHDLFEEGCSRQMCWDEENRLISFSDHCRNAGFYQYDANGERTYKLTGGYAAQNIQGHWWSYNLLDNPTLYASPYVVATPQGYTKHYYAESERIASRIGGGGLADIAQTVVNMEDLSGDVWAGEMQPIWDEVELSQYHINRLYESRNHLTDAMMCAGEDPIMEEDLLFELRDYWRYVQEDESVASEPDCYWYHPDHLGSSSWITYTDGSAVQHLHYLPWGEDFVDQRTTNWSALHTFSAKERDTETGLSYFGARYYSSDLSIWLSVDPMSDKYPSLSPYVYCADNPVKLMDPNGEEIGWVEKADGTIYWDENAHDQKTTKKGDTYLGEEGQRSVGTTVLNYHSDGTYNEQETVLIVDWGEDISTEYVRNNKTFKEREADFTNKSADFLQGLYIFLVSPINDLVVLTTSHDLYGNQVTKEDKTWSAIGIATFGSGKTLKILRLSDKVKKTKKIERGVEAVGTGLDIKTGRETYKKNNKRRNNYEKK